MSDGAGGSVDGTLVVTVANAAPRVLPDTAATDTDTAVLVDVLGNDDDANGDVLTVVPASLTVPVDAAGTPRGGVEVVDGQVRYTPPAVPATTVTVGNSGPSAIDVLAGASDPEGGELTVVDVEQPATGTVTVVDGRLVYTPEPGFVGTVTITFTVADPQGARTVSTVTVEVVATAAGGTTPVAVEAVPAPAGGALAVTGAQVSGVGAAAVLVLLVGAGLVVARRRWTHAG